MKIIVQDRQTYYDLAIQVLGNSDAAFELARYNGNNPTDDLAPGREIQIPISLYRNKEVQDYYAKQNLTPVTAIPILIEDDTPIWGLPYSL